MEAPDLSGNRLFTITAYDQRGTILIVAVICCIYCPMILSLRAVTSYKNLGTDDFVAVASTLTGIIQYAIVFAAVANGMGETFDDITSSKGLLLGKLTVASEVLFFITIALTKCCVVLLCRKLFSVSMEKHIILCDAVAGLCIVWGLGSILAVTVSCGPLQQIGFKTPFCSDLADRWIGVAVTDTITEILIFLLSIIVVFPLQMRVQRKITVALSFLPRLVIIIPISLHAGAVHRMVNSSPRGVGLTKPIVYLQVQLILGVVSAAIPALNRSLRLFNTSMGSTWWQTTFSQSNGKSAQSASRGYGDIPLEPLNMSRNRNQAKAPERNEVGSSENRPRLRPDDAAYNFSSSRVKQGEVDAQSGRSQDSTDSTARIIRKETHWHVTYSENP